MRTTPLHVKYITAAGLGFVFVLLLTAMSAMGFAEDRHQERLNDTFESTKIVVVQR